MGVFEYPDPFVPAVPTLTTLIPAPLGLHSGLGKPTCDTVSPQKGGPGDEVCVGRRQAGPVSRDWSWVVGAQVCTSPWYNRRRAGVSFPEAGSLQRLLEGVG